MDEQIYLIAQTYETDSLGQSIPKDGTPSPVWAKIKSVSRAEWAAAGQHGLQPQLVAIVYALDYADQPVVMIGEGESAKRYSVYRTYRPENSEYMELYLERKVGV